MAQKPSLAKRAILQLHLWWSMAAVNGCVSVFRVVSMLSKMVQVNGNRSENANVHDIPLACWERSGIYHTLKIYFSRRCVQGNERKSPSRGGDFLEGI